MQFELPRQTCVIGQSFIPRDPRVHAASGGCTRIGISKVPGLPDAKCAKSTATIRQDGVDFDSQAPRNQGVFVSVHVHVHGS